MLVFALAADLAGVSSRGRFKCNFSLLEKHQKPKGEHTTQKGNVMISGDIWLLITG